jgi:L-ascorbate metabolism protein UlaG (beta-lactamase superfamily)
VLSVTWLGHSTVVLDLDGVRLLTDPLLQRHAGLLRRRSPMPAASSWAGADAVLLSHLHPDHAELRSLRMLPGVPVLTAHENARWLRRRHIPAAVGLGEKWTDVGPDGAVQVRLVPAEHRHRPMPYRPNAANGHLLRAPSARVWVAGDTSLFAAMADLRALAGGTLDLAVIPIAGWGPRLSEGHLNPEQAATACARSGARWALPVHWGTLHPPFATRVPHGWLDRPDREFAQALAHLAPGCRVLRLTPGGAAVACP